MGELTRRVSWRQRLRYRFDNMMSAGPIAMVGWLAVLSLAVVIAAAVILLVTGARPEGTDDLGFIEGIWQSLLRTLDPGTMADDEGWTFRAVMLGVTIGGILVVSALIGVLTSGIEDRIEQLRKGRSHVIERGHTVILGWSPKVHRIISELAIANVNQPRGRIAVLADRDKVDMEDAIRATAGDLGRTKVICRRGNPQVPGDIAIVNAAEARSVIVLAPSEPDGDAHALKTLLALVNDPAPSDGNRHVVAEIQEPQHLDIAGIITRDNRAELVWSDQVIAHITAQTCRQSGLSVVYTELLDFSGDEIYFARVPSVEGKTFREVLLEFDTSAVIGIRYADGTLELNPPMDRRVAAGDTVIAIAEDDDRVVPDGEGDRIVDASALVPVRSSPPPVERTLLLNWNRRGALMVRELDRYVAEGSHVTVVAEDPDASAAAAELNASLRNISVEYRFGDPAQRALLEDVVAERYDHVVILHAGASETQEGDTRSIISLLQLRDIAARTGAQFSIVTEVLDRRNQELARVTQADDFIVSEEMISLMLAQVSENADLNAVLSDIFDAGHSEITLRPVSGYLHPDREINFATVVHAARERGEVAIGYRRAADATRPDRQYGVAINPRKSEPVTLSPDDRIIVLAR